MGREIDVKKVIICILLLIPILVILTIDASGKLIATALVDIPAENILIKHEGAVLNSKEVYLEEYKGTDKKFTVFCEVFPGIATDKMVWESSDPKVAEISPDPKREDAAFIRFHDYGSVDIVCTSTKNSSISARATLYVGGLIPGRLELSAYDGKQTEEITIPRYGVKSLLASVKPAQSVKGQKIEWSASEDGVVKVDNNGVVTALKEGETTVRATVTARGVTVTDTIKVKVEGTSLVTQSVVYGAGDTLDVTPYLAEGASVVGGNVVPMQDLSSFASKTVTVKLGEQSETLRVVKLETPQSLLVENHYALTEGVLSSFLALGTSNVELKWYAADGSSPAATWRSSDEKILVVKGNRVYAVGSGTAYVYPYAEGYQGEPVTISVVSPVEDFRLSETAFRDKVGLLQERVFGNLTYLNGNYTSNYKMTITSVYPSGAGIEAFSFDSTDASVATVNDNGVITFADNVQGKSVTITATAYNQEGLAVRQNYTFHLVNGVNIGYGVNNNTFGEKPSFTPYYDLKTVTSNKNVKTVVLLTDVYFPSKSDGGVTIKNMTASLYGNGKKVDGQYFINSVEETDKLFLWDFSKSTDMPESVDVSIVNVNMQATQPTSDDAQTAFDELSTKGGGAIGVRNGYPKGKHHFSIYVKGCLFQYAYGHVNVAIGDSVFDGCIFRNNSASAIVLQQSSYGVANAKIKNCIFSNTIAPVAIACGNFDDILARISGKKGYDPQFGTFELEGTNYVYNWKKLKDVQMRLLPRNLDDKTANSLVNTVNDKLGRIIQEAFRFSKKENLYLEDEAKYDSLTKVDETWEYLEEHSWLNFSFLMIGLWADMVDPKKENSIKIVFDEKQYKMVKVNAERAPSIYAFSSLADNIGISIEENETYHIICRDDNGAFNTKPGETYTIGEKTYARLRGERTS